MDKRALIIKVATHLFAAKGFEATSVRKIASDSGLSVPGMFHYFSTKEDILYEIMINFIEDAYSYINEILNSDIDSVQKLELLCTYYVQKYTEHQEELTILNSEGKSLTPKHRKSFIKKQQVYVEAFKEIINELAEKKIAKQINHSVMAFLFYGMVHWTSTWYDNSGDVSPEKLGKIVSEVFLHGILK